MSELPKVTEKGRAVFEEMQAANGTLDIVKAPRRYWLGFNYENASDMGIKVPVRADIFYHNPSGFERAVYDEVVPVVEKERK